MAWWCVAVPVEHRLVCFGSAQHGAHSSNTSLCTQRRRVPRVHMRQTPSNNGRVTPLLVRPSLSTSQFPFTFVLFGDPAYLDLGDTALFAQCLGSGGQGIV